MTILTFNRSLSAVIGKELLADLTELRNGLSKILPWDADVADRLDKFSRIAHTAQLRSVYKVLAASAAGARVLHTRGSESLLDATQKTLQALINHLNEMVNEHKNTPLRMAKPLQTLLGQLGQQSSPVFCSEMFMPFTPEDVSADRPSALAPSDFAVAIRDYRAAYQSGLIKLLKENDLSQYSALRQALVSIEPKNPHGGYRVFFEAAIATLDILGKNAELDNLAKWVLSKIDPELNQIAQGSTRVNDDLLSAMLHLVARADVNTSARVRKLQEYLNLKSYMADVNGIDPAMIEKFTQVLVKSREVWSQYAATEPLRVAKLISELQSKSTVLKNPGFTVVINALHEVISGIAVSKLDINPDQLSLEGAGALLILEQQLRDGPNMNNANLSASRLYGLIGKATDLIVSNSESQTTTATLHVLAAQIQDDLNQLELSLLEFLNGQRDGEPELRAGILKVSKIVGILGKENSLVQAFRWFERNLNKPSNANAKAEIATHFTQLSTLVESLKTSDKVALSAAQRWIEGLQKPEEPEEHDEYKDMPNDSAMLEIFLEEATSIIVDIEKGLAQLRTDPSMHDTVVNLRRGYHTLKGSSRMVGLVRFGDLAYTGELLLNNWIASKKIPSPELLDYYKKSLDVITMHVNNFKTRGYSHVEYAQFEQEALALGGTALGNAPQTSRSAIKFDRMKKASSAPAPLPIAEPETVSIPEPEVEAKEVSVFDVQPFVVQTDESSFEPAIVESPVFDFKSSDVSPAEPVLKDDPVFNFESVKPEESLPDHQSVSANAVDEISQEVNFESLETTVKGHPLVPDFLSLDPIKNNAPAEIDPMPELRMVDPEPLPEPIRIAPAPAPAPANKSTSLEPAELSSLASKAVKKTPDAWKKPGAMKTTKVGKKMEKPPTPPTAKLKTKKKGFLAWLLGLFRLKK